MKKTLIALTLLLAVVPAFASKDVLSAIRYGTKHPVTRSAKGVKWVGVHTGKALKWMFW